MERKRRHSGKANSNRVIKPAPIFPCSRSGFCFETPSFSQQMIQHTALLLIDRKQLASGSAFLLPGEIITPTKNNKCLYTNASATAAAAATVQQHSSTALLYDCQNRDLLLLPLSFSRAHWRSSVTRHRIRSRRHRMPPANVRDTFKKAKKEESFYAQKKMHKSQNRTIKIHC